MTEASPINTRAIRNQFDQVFKDLLSEPDCQFRQILTQNQAVMRELLTELTGFSSRIADRLWLLEDGQILHLELQATNDPLMPIRMAEYVLPIIRKYGIRIVQIVLYFGNAPLTMPSRMDVPGYVFSHRQIDIRDFSSAELLTSGSIADSLLSLLTGDGENALRQVLERLAALEPEKRQRAAVSLNNICGLRPGLSAKIKEELKSMPITYEDILANNPELARQHAELWEKGLSKGRLERSRSVLLQLLSLKLGPLPQDVSSRIAEAGETELSAWTVKVLHATTFEDVFGV
jgi:hypothetical protein